MALDDEQYALDNLAYLLSQFPSVELVYQSTDAIEALKRLPALGVDVLFLDISMPAMNGMEFARNVFAFNPKMRIIFLTAYDQYALDAFEVNAVDYILKPVTYAKLKRTLDKLVLTIAAETSHPPEAKRDEPMLLTGMRNGKYYVVKASDAQCIYVEQRKLLLAAGKERYALKNNLGYWEERLKDEGWFRCHRAFLINIQQIESTFPISNSVYYVVMKNSPIEIPISRSYLLAFRSLLNL